MPGTGVGTAHTVSSGPLNNSARGASLPPLMDEESAAWRSESMSPRGVQGLHEPLLLALIPTSHWSSGPLLNKCRDFSGGPVTKTLYSQCKGRGFNP